MTCVDKWNESALSMSPEIGPLEERAESQEAPITGAPT
jgi:hypothetical protein